MHSAYALPSGKSRRHKAIYRTASADKGSRVQCRATKCSQCAGCGACDKRLALYPFAAARLGTVTLDVMAIGFCGACATVLQTRLMDVAGDAQTPAAALNHSAFNVANALGPWLGGLAIAAGYGWTSTGWVGCGLALGGFH
jgi:MFS family permease